MSQSSSSISSKSTAQGTDNETAKLWELLRSDADRPLFETFVQQRDNMLHGEQNHREMIDHWVKFDKLDQRMKKGEDVSKDIQALASRVSPSHLPRSKEVELNLLLRYQATSLQSLLTDYTDFESYAEEWFADDTDDFVVQYFGTRADLVCFSATGIV